MSLGMVEVCYQQSSSILKFQDLEDEALSSELVSIQLPDGGHALHEVIKHHLSVAAVPLAFLSSRSSISLGQFISLVIKSAKTDFCPVLRL